MNKTKTDLSKLIEKYIDEHSPQGLEKLAVRCSVSRTTIEKARCGNLPKRDRTLDRIVQGLGIQRKQLALDDAS